MVAEPNEAMKSKQNDRKQKGQYKLTNRQIIHGKKQRTIVIKNWQRIVKSCLPA